MNGRLLVSEKAYETVKKGGQWLGAFQTILDTLARTDSFAGSNFQDRPGYFHKRLNSLRIFGIQEGNDKKIITVLEKSSSDYENFEKEQKRSIRKAKEMIEEWDKANAYREHKPAEVNQKVVDVKPNLPQSLSNWLVSSTFENRAHCKEDIKIYDSSFWVDEICKLDGHHLPHFYDMIEGIIDLEACKKKGEESDKCTVHFNEQNGRTIFYSYAFKSGVVEAVIFLSFSTENEGKAFNNAKQRAQEIIDTWDSSSIHDLQRCALRYYPYSLLADDEAWIKVQQNKEDNLALTPEEQELFDGIWQDPASSGKGMPLFINGSAGSGKSTMLQWAFAKCCLHSIKNDALKGWHPVYITWSEELLNKARTKVDSLLSFNVDNQTDYDIEDNEKKWVKDTLMKPYQGYLLDLLKNNARDVYREDNFCNHYKFVNLLRFKRLFKDEKFTWPTELTPEFSWHVIRVFIKGWGDQAADGSRQYLTPEKYKTLDQEDKTVSQEKYELVYKTVWKKYLEYCEEDGLWDQQDLVEKVLDLGIQMTISNPDDVDFKSEGISSVFCDEAQDLTRLELESVMMMTSYSNYDLSKSVYFDRLPFVFAGDPQQTVQPTGFRWKAFKSAFYTKIVMPLTGHRKGLEIQPNLVTLTHNLRSSKSIIEIGNSIQLLRKHLFDDPIQPQSSWHTDINDAALVSSGPIVFAIDPNDPPNALIKELKGSIIVVPCDFGGESKYIKDTPLLQSILSENSDDNLNVVFSSARAKGLEFKNVVLLGFGDKFKERKFKVKTLISNAKNSRGSLLNHERLDLSESQSLDLEYWLNKLYVGISRPTQQLFLIEDIEGCEAFWENLEDNNKELLKINEDWLGLTLNKVTKGSSTHYMQLAKSSDPIANAKVLEQHGKDAQCHESYGSARYFYNQKNGHEDDANRCLAHQIKIQANDDIVAGNHSEASKRFKKASDIFMSLDLRKEAVECLWDGHLWSNYCDAARDYSDWKFKLSKFMERSENPDETTADPVRFVEQLGQFFRSESRNPEESQWRSLAEVYSKYIELLCKGKLKLDFNAEDQCTSEFKNSVKDTVELLFEDGFSDYLTLHAKTLFWSECDSEAVELICSMQQLLDTVKDQEYKSKFYITRANDFDFFKAMDCMLKVNQNDYPLLPKYIMNSWNKEPGRYKIKRDDFLAIFANKNHQVVFDNLIEYCEMQSNFKDLLFFELMKDKTSWSKIRNCIVQTATRGQGEEIDSCLEIVRYHGNEFNKVGRGYSILDIITQLSVKEVIPEVENMTPWKRVLREKLQGFNLLLLNQISYLPMNDFHASARGTAYRRLDDNLPWNKLEIKKTLNHLIKQKYVATNLDPLVYTSLLEKLSKYAPSKKARDTFIFHAQKIYLTIMTSEIGREAEVPVLSYRNTTWDSKHNVIVSSHDHAAHRWFKLQDHLCKLYLDEDSRLYDDAVQEGKTFLNNVFKDNTKARDSFTELNKQKPLYSGRDDLVAELKVIPDSVLEVKILETNNKSEVLLWLETKSPEEREILEDLPLDKQMKLAKIYWSEQ